MEDNISALQKKMTQIYIKISKKAAEHNAHPMIYKLLIKIIKITYSWTLFFHTHILPVTDATWGITKTVSFGSQQVNYFRGWEETHFP